MRWYEMGKILFESYFHRSCSLVIFADRVSPTNKTFTWEVSSFYMGLYFTNVLISRILSNTEQQLIVS